MSIKVDPTVTVTLSNPTVLIIKPEVSPEVTITVVST